MDIEKYIASGILELYVAGALSEKENQEVYEAMQKYPEIKAEVASIEAAIMQLTSGANTGFNPSFTAIQQKLNIGDEPKVIPIRKSRNSWLQYTGWVASIILATALVYTTNQKNSLEDKIAKERIQLEGLIEDSYNSLAEAEKLIDVFRDKDIINVPLAGQNVSPNSYAKVYWDKKTNSIYLDAKGLPVPPKGKVYQVWSLKLDPLTPTSLGTLDTFTADANKIFTITNANASEAFGITLEPEGGSKTPTLEQLYTLGAVSS